jgi:hypothetical protein
MARPTFQGISAPEIIQPVAQPVNTYVRPADPAPSPLHGLAEGLASLSSGLTNFMEKRQAVTDQEDALKGQEAFNENNQIGWAELVKQNPAMASKSPVFMKSYKAAQGDLAGIQLQEQFNREYLAWPGKTDTNPEAFKTFLTDFISKNGLSNDPGVLRGLLPHINQLKENAYKAWSDDSGKAAYESAANTQAAISGRTIDAANKQGMLDPKGVNYDGLWADMMSRREQQLKTGLLPDDLDDGMVGSITAKAVENADPKLLDILDRKVPGKDINYSDLPKYRAAIDDARHKIDTIGRQKGEDARLAQQAADKKERGQLWAGISLKLSTDPRAPIEDSVFERLGVLGDGKARQTVAEMRSTFNNGEALEDPSEILHLQEDIASGKINSLEDLNKRVGHSIQDPKTFATLADRLTKVQEQKAKGTDVFADRTANFYLTQIRDRTRDPKLVQSLLGDESMSDEGMQARMDLQTAIWHWDDTHPDGDPTERAQFIDKVGTMIVSRIDKNVLADDPRKYTSEQDLAQQKADDSLRGKEMAPIGERKAEEPSADTVGAQKVQEEGAKPAEVVPEAVPKDDPNQLDGSETQKFYSGDTPPAWQELPGDVKHAIGETVKAINEQVDADVEAGKIPKADADAHKITIEELNTKMWEETHKQLDKQGLKKTSLEADPEDAKLIEAAYTNDAEGTAESQKTPFDAILQETTPVTSIKQGYFEEPMKSPKVAPEVVARYRSGRHIPVSIRNNNPAAISFTGNELASFAARQPGYAGKSKRPANEGGWYAKFSTPEAGIAAASKLLERYGSKGVDTPYAIVKKWSTGATAWNSYAHTLVKYLKAAGWDGDINTRLDLSNPEVRKAILMAQSAHESGIGKPVYNEDVYSRALRGELGIDHNEGDSEA